ncbi:MAG: hypothetical protein AAF975_07635 [Spirochaetota bacterium]
MNIRLIFVSALLWSCASYRPSEKFAGSSYYGPIMDKYQFHRAKSLNESLREKLNLSGAENLKYVLFKQYYRDFIAETPGKERLYIIGERRRAIEDNFQKDFYKVFAIVLYTEKQAPRQGRRSKFPLADNSNQNIAKNFVLSVQDFSGDGLDDLFFGFVGESQSYYYMYRFKGMELQAIVRPWNSFSDSESKASKYYSPFMRELSADIYPAFVAEIELELNYKINIDLSPLADDLIRDKVYDKQGLVLRKQGIPHLDFNPILFPIWDESGKYMLRSVQQVRSRYGQIGILVCNWIFREEGEPAARWLPVESSMEFLTKPRI